MKSSHAAALKATKATSLYLGTSPPDMDYKCYITLDRRLDGSVCTRTEALSTQTYSLYYLLISKAKI